MEHSADVLETAQMTTTGSTMEIMSTATYITRATLGTRAVRPTRASPRSSPQPSHELPNQKNENPVQRSIGSAALRCSAPKEVGHPADQASAYARFRADMYFSSLLCRW
jgi:hypothetical protein